MIRNLTLKRRMLAASVLGALVLLPVSQPAVGGHATPLEKELRRKINAYREENGKAKLKMKDKLVTKARAQAGRMAADGLFCPPTDEPEPGCEGKSDHSTDTRLTNYLKAGKCDTKPFLAEIIASTIVLAEATPDAMIEAWKASKGPEGHNKIMLKKKWEKIGTGIHVDDAGNLWGVVLFCSTK